MLEQIKKMVADNLGVEESKITENASFKDDLGADSLDLFELTMALEDEYGIEIPSEDLEKIVTVGDVVEYVNAHKEQEIYVVYRMIPACICHRWAWYNGITEWRIS